MQKVDGILSGFEEKLVKDGAILEKPNALSSRSLEFQVCITTQVNSVLYSHSGLICVNHMLSRLY